MVRLIVVSNPSGSKEDILFTEDEDLNAEDCCASDQEVSIDIELPIDLPDTFPLEHTFRRLL